MSSEKDKERARKDESSWQDERGNDNCIPRTNVVEMWFCVMLTISKLTSYLPSAPAQRSLQGGK
jgi:hypothetical protein